MRDHAAEEAKLREVGVRWTALRNGFNASTVPAIMVDEAASTGVIAPPARARSQGLTRPSPR